MQPPVIHWFRRDLRLSDNLALDAAARSGQPVLPVFVYDPAIVRSPRVARPRLKFLLASLAALEDSLRRQGSRLLFRIGPPDEALAEIARQSGATAVYTNRDYTPFALRRDAAAAARLSIPLHSFDDALLVAPGDVLTEAGKPLTVFTPFKRRWLTIPKAASVDAPTAVQFVAAEWIDALDAASAGIFTQGIPLDRTAELNHFSDQVTIPVPAAGEAEAQRRLMRFLSERVHGYGDGRNWLAAQSADDTDPATSFLSPYLRFGMLSPRQAYWAARAAYQAAETQTGREGVETWISELVWREFYMHILAHFPHVLERNFKPAYDRLEWRSAPDELAAWKAGMTGYPVVDAAMRQLQAMGWMPNRARMIVASFLTKDLLIDWREGERHFMDWLIDGDPAANNGGWQWSAGTGTDAQPYFRIFNPVSQSQKFDPDGAYIRRWVPELRDLAAEAIHAPWDIAAPPRNYPRPIVDHTLARDRTLAAFKAVGES
jgi:deoxyribodipyrimidine photo-lyase